MELVAVTQAALCLNEEFNKYLPSLKAERKCYSRFCSARQPRCASISILRCGISPTMALEEVLPGVLLLTYCVLHPRTGGFCMGEGGRAQKRNQLIIQPQQGGFLINFF